MSVYIRPPVSVVTRSRSLTVFDTLPTTRFIVCFFID